MDVKENALNILNCGLDLLVNNKDISQSDRVEIYRNITSCIKKNKEQVSSSTVFDEKRSSEQVKKVFLGVKEL